MRRVKRLGGGGSRIWVLCAALVCIVFLLVSTKRLLVQLAQAKPNKTTPDNIPATTARPTTREPTVAITTRPPTTTSPTTNASLLLESIFLKHGYMPPSAKEVDYMDRVYDMEAANLVVFANAFASSSAVSKSLFIMARRGHRTRVVDLIGGKHHDPATHKRLLVEQASVFQRKATSTRDFRHDRINAVGVECNVRHLPPCGKSTSTQTAFTFFSTMENVQCKDMHGRYSLCGNTMLTSDVPVPYISWHDFGVLSPLAAGNKSLLAAAFISNCAFSKRNDMVTALIAKTNGTTHSFGGCVHSSNTLPPHARKSNSRDAEKLQALQQYKFSLAFENSETKDYVTEKFFGSLCAGAVPVVIGAPNAAFYAPDTGPFPYTTSRAMIHAQDFAFDANKLAALMMELAETPAAYDEMLAWKNKGYSLDYKALVDLADVHSECRACIALADDLRHREGANMYDLDVLQQHCNKIDNATFILYVRERGSYAFTELGFASKPQTLGEVVVRVLECVKERKKNLWINNENRERNGEAARVYALYMPRPARLPVLSNEDLLALKSGTELEVIFV